MEWLVLIAIFIAIVAAIHGACQGLTSDKARQVRENKHNRELRQRLEDREANLRSIEKQKAHEFAQKELYFSDLTEAFAEGTIQGREWLAEYIAESHHARDEAIAYALRTKKHPAKKASEEVTKARQEKRHFQAEATYLKYHLQTLREYFPFIEEYEDIILNDSIDLSNTSTNTDDLHSIDPVLKYIPTQDFQRLSITERNQLALDKYLSRNHNNQSIGRMYERYIGYLRECDGWDVEYVGIFKGLEDLGRDLVCRKDGKTTIIQAKCWSANKTIHEKHIFQLFGTTQLHIMALNAANSNLFTPSCTASFVTTTSLSEVAKQAADHLGIKYREKLALDKNYPMIKCNINQTTGEKIYHLPFDQQYDRTKIIKSLGELYVRTVAEAEANGFRRAFRHQPSN